MTFIWGAATSSHQVDGQNVHSDWWAWEAEGHIEGAVRSGVATDHWNRFDEDLALAQEMGLNGYRFGVEWARLEPEQGRFNEAAFERYDRLLDACEKRGLEPMATLHHFTSPLWFAQLGGFASPQAPELFMRFAREVVKRWGARVPKWCTFNEPMVLIVGTYLARFMPPAEFSPAKAMRACEGILRSHARAYDLLHQAAREGGYPQPLVGIAQNLVDFTADRAWHPIERALAWGVDRVYNWSFLEAVNGRKQSFGFPGLTPASVTVPEAMGRKTCDFVGVNYYTKGYLRWRPRDASPETPADLPFGIAFARRKEPRSDLGWAIHPEGLRALLRRSARYGLPILVTENGIADRDDRLRPEYLLQHLRVIAELRENEGLPIEGYYHWSLLDNFEWIKGYWPRFGLIRIDYEDLSRHKTSTSELLSRVVKAHRRAEGAACAPRSELLVWQPEGG